MRFLKPVKMRHDLQGWWKFYIDVAAVDSSWKDKLSPPFFNMAPFLRKTVYCVSEPDPLLNIEHQNSEELQVLWSFSYKRASFTYNLIIVWTVCNWRTDYLM